MSVIFQFIVGEIIAPFIYGMGWLIVMLLSFGLIRPTKESFFKQPIVGLVGLYAWVAVPTAIALGYRNFFQ